VRLLLVSVGRSKAGPERDLTERYLERAAAAGRDLGVTIEHREIDEGKARRPQDRKLEEAKAIRALLGGSARIIVCDEAGKALTSAELAADLGRSRDQGVPMLSLIIGGPDGLAPNFCRGGSRPCLRHHDLAASAGAQHGCRADLSRHHDPRRAPLSSALTAKPAVWRLTSAIASFASCDSRRRT
jgi:23S rRNA (pseudouridine1915-N3)-methyltransferase